MSMFDDLNNEELANSMKKSNQKKNKATVKGEETNEPTETLDLSNMKFTIAKKKERKFSKTITITEKNNQRVKKLAQLTGTNDSEVINDLIKAAAQSAKID